MQHKKWIAVAAIAATAALQLPTAGPALAATVCNRYCDGRDPALSPGDRVPVSTTLYGRTFKVHVNDTDAMIWATVENGRPGDQVWLDRSFDGGAAGAGTAGSATPPSRPGPPGGVRRCSTSTTGTTGASACSGPAARPVTARSWCAASGRAATGTPGTGVRPRPPR
ncbi:hypothetical protein Asp14428_42090 [Actinoplanes sp. NBRC 14428]|nr:hypothetical protein Asp14428_42090 [Actinoplanes sp. NBRC 14428]